MDTMTAAEAKQKFGELLEKAQRGPVAITKHGRRVAVFYSNDDFEFEQDRKKTWLDTQLAAGVQEIEDGKTRSASEVHERILNSFKTS